MTAATEYQSRKSTRSFRPTFEGFEPRLVPAALTGTAATAIVTGLYHEMLRQSPGAADLAMYTQLLEGGGKVSQVVNDLYSSTAFRSEEVTSYYVDMLDRDPTATELSQATSQLSSGVPEDKVIAEIAGTTEFYNHSGGTATSFVQSLYLDLRGQHADANGLGFYVHQVYSQATPLAVATEFTSSVRFREVKIQEIHEVVLGRPAATAEVNRDVENWTADGGIAGLSIRTLDGYPNLERLLGHGGVPSPNMTAVNELQRILLAPYDERSTGFVSLFNSLLHTNGTSAPGNTALFHLIKTGGTTDGLAHDEMISARPMTLNLGSLIPLQNEVDMNGSLKFVLTDPAVLRQYLQGGTILHPAGAILTADGGQYIVDGHHRWSAIYVINPYVQISAIDLGYVPTPLDALKEAQVAIGAELGFLPVKTVQGQNLFTISQTDFNAYIVKTVNDSGKAMETLQVFKEIKGLDGLPAIENYLWANVLRMRQFNQPLQGVTSRGYMPQPPNNDYQPILHLLESGQLNYRTPVIARLG